MKQKQKDGFQDAFFSVYYRVPDGVKKHTDKYVKMGLRVNRQIHPWAEKSRAQGDAWVEKHINRRVKVVTGFLPNKKRK